MIRDQRDLDYALLTLILEPPPWGQARFLLRLSYELHTMHKFSFDLLSMIVHA
jgi:hypothetical protein